MIEWKVFQYDGRFDYNRFRYYICLPLCLVSFCNNPFFIFHLRRNHIVDAAYQQMLVTIVFYQKMTME